MIDAPTIDRAAELAEHAAEFLSFERDYGGSSEAARLTTRHTLRDVAEEIGVPAGEIEAAVDAAIKAATNATTGAL